ncbi:hypothetical protein NL676_022027 [Syzygium grande]|nr:hypothetical protein NL676_022027 [Syzygium grande]
MMRSRVLAPRKSTSDLSGDFISLVEPETSGDSKDGGSRVDQTFMAEESWEDEGLLPKTLEFNWRESSPFFWPFSICSQELIIATACRSSPRLLVASRHCNPARSISSPRLPAATQLVATAACCLSHRNVARCRSSPEPSLSPLIAVAGRCINRYNPTHCRSSPQLLTTSVATTQLVQPLGHHKGQLTVPRLPQSRSHYYYCF